MKKIITGLMIALLFLGCSKDEELTNVEPKLVVGKSLVNLALQDQFGNPQIIKPTTTKVIFAFSKDMAHICNDYLATQKATYLNDNHSVFIADVSAAPSLIRSMFILPGLKDFKHTVALLDDKAVAAPYRVTQDTEKIIVVYVQNQIITNIKTINSEAELKTVIEVK